MGLDADIVEEVVKASHLLVYLLNGLVPFRVDVARTRGALVHVQEKSILIREANHFLQEHFMVNFRKSAVEVGQKGDQLLNRCLNRAKFRVDAHHFLNRFTYI